MEFKPRFPIYSKKWLNQLDSFVETYKLCRKDTPLLLCVSGGVDSMNLILAFYQLRTFGYSNDLRVLHIDHGTRDDQKKEAQVVELLCESLALGFQSVQAQGLDVTQNFEHLARTKRYEIFEKVRSRDELIVLGHHLDDSFEWSLMQSLRSSNLKSSLGIPVKNNFIIRPFMCFSKKQVRAFASCYGLKYLEDPTNYDNKYERNFLRNEVIPNFQKKYPNYLKHYVHQKNELARKFGVHLLKNKESSFNLSLNKDSALIYSFDLNSRFSGIEELLLMGLKHLNPNSRGKVNSQLSNIVNAMKNGKSGPLALTNSWQAYIDFNLVLLYKGQKTNQKLQATVEKMYTFLEFQKLVFEIISDKNNHLLFPFPVFVCSSKLDKRQFKPNFNAEVLSNFANIGEQYYPAMKLLREWSKKRNRHRVLGLRFLTCLNS